MQIRQGEAGCVARQSYKDLVLNIRSNTGKAGRGHFFQEPLDAGVVVAVDGFPLVFLGAQFYCVNVFVAVFAYLKSIFKNLKSFTAT